MVSIVKRLATEKVFIVSKKLPFSLKEGIVRLVDKKGRTIALILDKEAIQDLEEELAALSPRFISSLNKSRRSGRVPGSEVKRKAK